MNNRFFRCFAACLTLFIFVTLLPTGAYGADGTSILTFHDLKGNFTVSPGSAYTQSDLFSSFKEMMPGDTKTEKIQIQNQCEEKRPMRLFLRSVSHDDKTNPPVAAGEDISSMEDFLSQLTLSVWVRDKLVFQGAGNLPFRESVPLGVIPWGENGEIKAEISLPITLGNEYADRIGEIDWVFVTEDAGDNPGEDENLTVRKLWSDGNDTHKDQKITVYLKRNGEPWSSGVLHAGNQWCITFSDLDSSAQWTVEEITAIEGYTPEYKEEKGLVTIINQADGGDPHVKPKPKALSVVKQWAEPNKPHPDHVSCILYRDKTPIETVRLDASNKWTYHWKDLDGAANWQVVESYCEGSYVPSYEVKADGTVVITNTAKLIHTGQLNLPIPILLILGMGLLGAGFWLRKRHEK